MATAPASAGPSVDPEIEQSPIVPAIASALLAVESALFAVEHALQVTETEYGCVVSNVTVTESKATSVLETAGKAADNVTEAKIATKETSDALCVALNSNIFPSETVEYLKQNASDAKETEKSAITLTETAAAVAITERSKALNLSAQASVMQNVLARLRCAESAMHAANEAASHIPCLQPARNINTRGDMLATIFDALNQILSVDKLEVRD